MEQQLTTTMLRDKLVYVLLLFCFFSFGQQRSKMLQASIQQASGGCTPDANEQFTTADAASDPNCNEANSSAAWTGDFNATSSSQSSEVYEGSYAISGVADGGAVGIIRHYFAATSGDTFTVTFWAKSTQGSFVRITGWTNCTGGPSSVTPTGTWTEYTYNITASATDDIQIRFYPAAATGAVAGDNIFIDNLSIIKTN